MTNRNDRCRRWSHLQARWEAHKAQILKQQTDDAVAAGAGNFAADAESSSAGTLADDESLAALRERLTSR